MWQRISNGLGHAAAVPAAAATVAAISAAVAVVSEKGLGNKKRWQ